MEPNARTVNAESFLKFPFVTSCHTVRVQFHEDLLATLGIPRGADA